MGSSNPKDFNNSPSSMISVKEILKLGPTITVPQQFVGLNQESLSVSFTGIAPLPATPTIDMAHSRLVSRDDEDLELQKLHSACKD
ncbi:hypothetical protein PTKIN_Ptkin06aG0119500 [Pterospermum kingtungense]